MGLIIHQERIDETAAQRLIDICPFGAIEKLESGIAIGSGCKLCRLCVRSGPKGAITFEEEPVTTCNKEAYSGVAVFAELRNGKVHPVVLELIEKAKSLAEVTSQQVLAVIIGWNVEETARELLDYGVNNVFCYDHHGFEHFIAAAYSNAFEDFIRRVRPSSILVGATSVGRSLAPAVAARVCSGITADCTFLEMRANTDLVQIRPAFGGNIMAQIISPNCRPQFCTVRYKVFPAGSKRKAQGMLTRVEVSEDMVKSGTCVLSVKEKPRQIDISEAEAIVACGRGLRSQKDIKLCEALAEALNAQIACTRPLVECGWFDVTHQIGLSGRTVKPKLIIAVGISGSVQFVAGMRSADLVIAINSDRNAPIFDIAHYGFVGDLYEILPGLVSMIQDR